MKSLLKLNTTEAGKVISLVATVPSTILVCNIEKINTDQSSFSYNAETGELTILRRGYFKVSGCLNLVEPISGTADLTINLVVDGTPLFQLYTGTNNQRNFVSYTEFFYGGSVVTFEVIDQATEDIETASGEHFIQLERIY